MYELAVTYVHSDMAYRINIIREINQISQPEIALGNGSTVIFILAARTTLKLITVLSVDIVH